MPEGGFGEQLNRIESKVDSVDKHVQEIARTQATAGVRIEVLTAELAAHKADTEKARLDHEARIRALEGFSMKVLGQLIGAAGAGGGVAAGVIKLLGD